MELLAQFWDVVLHLDRHLEVLLLQYGPWIYGLLFLIIFCETGLVIAPFLPGDSLLFVAGALWANAGMDAPLLAARARLCGECGAPVSALGFPGEAPPLLRGICTEQGVHVGRCRTYYDPFRREWDMWWTCCLESSRIIL